mmetsp:Transcript_112971/g.319512  ORF Transcript_112971/g.319512 Transcript_112971/m.319512 type:complete len:240 (-) Transcript_112971:760-1479(-)
MVGDLGQELLLVLIEVAAHPSLVSFPRHLLVRDGLTQSLMVLGAREPVSVNGLMYVVHLALPRHSLLLDRIAEFRTQIPHDHLAMLNDATVQPVLVPGKLAVQQLFVTVEVALDSFLVRIYFCLHPLRMGFQPLVEVALDPLAVGLSRHPLRFEQILHGPVRFLPSAPIAVENVPQVRDVSRPRLRLIGDRGMEPVFYPFASQIHDVIHLLVCHRPCSLFLLQANGHIGILALQLFQRQ